MQRYCRLWAWFLAGASLASGCGPPANDAFDPIAGTFAAEGGTLYAEGDGEAAGLALEVPAGAFAEPSTFTLVEVRDTTPLPVGALGVGPQFELLWEAGRPQEMPTLSLPFDEGLVESHGQDWQQVKVWKRASEGWQLVDAAVNTPQAVAIRVDDGGVFFAGIKLGD